MKKTVTCPWCRLAFQFNQLTKEVMRSLTGFQVYPFKTQIQLDIVHGWIETRDKDISHPRRKFLTLREKIRNYKDLFCFILWRSFVFLMTSKMPLYTTEYSNNGEDQFNFRCINFQLLFRWIWKVNIYIFDKYVLFYICKQYNCAIEIDREFYIFFLQKFSPSHFWQWPTFNKSLFICKMENY